MSSKFEKPLLFAFILAVYILTLAPTVTGEDSGELIAAAYTLGVPHPSGYPLWCLVTQPFLWLPLGDIAYRVNLASAVTTALACTMFAELLRQLRVSLWQRVGSALLLAFSATLWCQSVIAEVYPLTLLTLVLLLLCLNRWRERPDSQKWLHASALLAGLCLAAHHTVVLLYPLIFLLALRWGGKRLLRPTVWLCFLAGLSVYLYLPLRAAAHPAMNWGSPDSPERFWAHVTRAQYPSLLGSSHTLALCLGQLRAVGSYFLNQWPWPVSLLVALGALLAVRRNKVLALAFVLLSGVFALLLNFGLDYEELHIAEVFFIPAWLFVVLLFARASQRWGWLTMAMALVSLGWNFPQCTMAGNTVARRYGEDALKTLPPDALLFTGADYEAFPLTYLQVVERQRPDVVVLHENSDLGRAQQLVREKERPVYATRPMGEFSAGPWQPVGLLYAQLQDPTQTKALDASAWEQYQPRLNEGVWKHDWSTASLLCLYDLAESRSLFAYHRDPGLQLLQRAAERQPDDALLLNSIGATLTRYGKPEKALDYYRKALAVRPDYAPARRNAVVALASLGHWQEARQIFDAHLKGREPALDRLLLEAQILQPDFEEAQARTAQDPGNSEAWLQLALLKVRLHRADAVSDLEKCLQLNPKDQRARDLLRQLRPE